MRKFLLLFVFLGITTLTKAQVDTVLFETFDAGLPTTGWTYTGPWNDTDLVSVSPNMSLHTYGRSGNTIHSFELPPFSSIGFPFVFLDFYQICKFTAFNQGLFQYSIDSGNTWVDITEQYYKGTSAAFPANGPVLFNQLAYATQGNRWSNNNNVNPTNSWYIQESLDLTDIFEGPNGMGYADCRIRFLARFTFPPFYSGWYIDNLLLRRSPCELTKPTINIDYTGFTPPNGCINKPTNGVTQISTNSYEVSTLARDDTAGIDVVLLHWRNRTNGIWNIDTMTWTNVTFNPGPNEQREYSALITNLLVGDTADYFISAYDDACPIKSNRARVPDSLFQEYFTFWPQTGLPLRCGNPDCGVLPTTIKNFPYLQNFESPTFISGGNATNRGTFPVGDRTGNYWSNVVNPGTSNYTWGVRGTGGAATYTPLTGPSGNHSAGGSQYIYVEASGGSFGDKASLITPCIDLTNVTPGSCLVLEFWYHMYGDQMGTLDVGIDNTSNTGPGYTTEITLTGEQQDSATQEWKRAVIDISSHIGSFIKVRFRAEKRSGGDRGDIALDDLKIYLPPNTELELTEMVSPFRGECAPTLEPVTVKYRTTSCNNPSFIPFAYNINGGAVVRDTLFGTFGLGDTGTFTFGTLADLSALGTYTIRAWTDDSNEGDRSNDTVVSGLIENVTPFSSFPYLQRFEAGTVGTRNFGFLAPAFKLRSGSDPNFGWQIGREITPTNGTGPWRGYYFDANSKYIYTSSTQAGGGASTTAQVSTYLESISCFDFSSMTSPMMTFMYHMYGTAIDRITVEYLSDPQREIWTQVPNSAVIRAAQVSSFTTETSAWKQAKIDLSSIPSGSTKIRIRGARSSTGGILSDLAIDNLFIFDRDAQDVGVSRINVPNMVVPSDGFISPQVTVQNYTNSTLTNVPINVEITPLCGPNANVPVTYTLTIPSLPGPVGNSPFDNGETVFTFDHTQTTPVMQFPKGEFIIKVYTSLTGDDNNFNDTVAKRNVRQGLEQIPFFDNFDNCNFSESGFATLGSGLRQWELGVPGAPFTGAFTSPNAWTVNKEGNVEPGRTEILKIPDFYGFDSVVAVEIRMYQNNKFGASNSQSSGRVEYFGRTPQGNPGWVVLNGIDPTLGRWLDSQIGELNNPVFGNSPGFINTSGWEYSWYPMNFFNFFTDTVAMRMNYKINSGATNVGGWSIDNFSIFVPPQHSAAPTRVRTFNPLPIPGNDQPVTITVRNTGKRLLEEFLVKVIFDVTTTPVDLGWDTITVPIINMTEGREIAVPYKYVIPASLATAGIHDVCIITSRPNDEDDDIPSDDTLCTTIRILDEFIFDNGTNSEFCNNFDGNLGTFEFFGLNNYTYSNDPARYSWERGAPTVGPGSAFSAPNAWATNLTGNYKQRDSSSLYTPVFVVEKDTSYELSFMHYYETERATDGGTFMISDDGGLTWQTVGWAQEKNWFNTSFVNALDIVRPGWSDTSGVWDTARYVFSFEQGDQVIFKFRFESDWDIEYSGWVIDDFCIKKTQEAPQFIIGVDEYNPSVSTFFGELAPNPTKGAAALPFSIADNKSMDILVTNMMGQTIERRSEEFRVGSNAISFETQGWSPGIYNISVAVDGKVINRKLVVQ